MSSISIIIAAYNAEKFIDRAINSALCQKELPHEIIIVNDASSDNTAHVLDKFAAQNSIVKVHHLAQNGGPAIARNKGLDIATGDWVAILDADDAIEPEFTKSVATAIKAYSPDIVATNFYWFDIVRNKHIEKGLSQLNTDKIIDKYEFINGARPFSDEADYGLLKPVFNLSFLRQHKLQYPSTLRHGEDFTLLAKTLFLDAKFVVLRMPLYLYTTRDSGFSQTIADYTKMSQHTLHLLSLPTVKNDAKLKDLIKLRAKSLNRLNAQILLNKNIKNRELGDIIKNSTKDKFYRNQILKYIAKKILGR